MIVTIYFEVDHKKTGFGPKNSIFGPQKGHFGQLGPQTARRAAKRAPTGKLKVSRATSEYGGLMIPLSQDRPSRKNGGFIGVA